jgi:superfamily I DNA and/or RNA helicase
LQENATVRADRGVLLSESRRLHPALCKFISEAIYDGRLKAHPDAATRQLLLQTGAHPALQAAGLTFLGVKHFGCTQSSPAEAEAIAALIADLQRHRVQKSGASIAQLSLDDILVVAPYNMQVNLLKQRLPQGTKIGTVDKFQGQEAAVVIVSMTTSRGEDAPRGTDFLFNRNRFNVAISRAQCLAVVVHSKELFEGSWLRTEDLVRLNLFASRDNRKVCFRLAGRA